MNKPYSQKKTPVAIFVMRSESGLTSPLAMVQSF
jgi:hypothetical protein